MCAEKFIKSKIGQGKPVLWSWGGGGKGATEGERRGKGNLCHHSCFAPKAVSFVSIETPKLAVSLFRETSETSLFVTDSV